MKFRFHRGGLDESMATCVEIEPTIAALTQHINANDPLGAWTDGDVEVRPYGYDKRINWDTHMVLKGGYPVGFADGDVTR